MSNDKQDQELSQGPAAQRDGRSGRELIKQMRIANPISILLGLALMVNPWAFAASVDRNPDPLQARTGHMTFAQANMLDALLAIAENVRVPFGIACADDWMRRTKVSAEISEGSLGNALSLITAGHPGVQFSVQHGVVVIERFPLPENCKFLDLSIPDFYAQRDTVEHLSAKLWMTLEMQLVPGKKGFAGILHPNQADRAIGPADLRGERVRDILNWMVEHHGASAWVATPNNNPSAAASDELWKIVFYDRNQADAP